MQLFNVYADGELMNEKPLNDLQAKALEDELIAEGYDVKVEGFLTIRIAC